MESDEDILFEPMTQKEMDELDKDWDLDWDMNKSNPAPEIKQEPTNLGDLLKPIGTKPVED
jgi:hypothetical protein